VLVFGCRDEHDTLVVALKGNVTVQIADEQEDVLIEAVRRR